MIDLVGLSVAWYVAFWLRLVLNPFLSVQFTADRLREVAPPLTGILLLWIAAGVWLGLYRCRDEAVSGWWLRRLVESVVLAGTLTVLVTFFCREFGANLSRSFVLLFVPASFAVLGSALAATRLAAERLDRMWPQPERVAVIGHGAEVRLVVDRIRSVGPDRVTVVGVILPAGASSDELGPRVAVLGTTRQLGELTNRQQLERVVIVNGCLGQTELDHCGRIARRMGVVLDHVLDLRVLDAPVSFTQRYGLPLLELRPSSLTRRQERVKRACDILLAATVLLALAPVLLLFALLVRLTSPGPVFYISPRVGKGGRHFPFFKFRSMRYGSRDRRELAVRNEQNGHVFKIRNDPRITPLGRFIRRYSIDELPQLWNVLRGEMSLVGPRPLPAEDLDTDGMSRDFAFWAEQRSRVLPGITGLWQVSGRSESPFERMIEQDLLYIQNWSLLLDLKILLQTPLAVLTARGAY